MLEKVVFAIESTLITLTRAEWAGEGVITRAVNFSFVALEAGFIPKGFIGAGILLADVWTGVLVLMSPALM